MLPLGEKEKVLDFIRKGEKNHTRRSPRCMARTDLPSVKLRRRREKCALVRRLASARESDGRGRAKCFVKTGRRSVCCCDE